MTVDLDEFRKSCLKGHNELRARHGAPPLKLNEQLSNFSQQWAEHLANSGLFEHRDNPRLSPIPEKKSGKKKKAKKLPPGQMPRNGDELPQDLLGENLVELIPSETGEDAAKWWYSEIEYYDWEKTWQNHKKSGHFSQLIWKDSKEVGVGACELNDGSGKMIVVANYRPSGNWDFLWTDNIKPAGDFV